jgi:hypothetical protein
MKWQFLQAFSFANSALSLTLLLFCLFFNPIKATQEWLTHSEAYLTAGSTLWEAYSYDPGSNAVSFAQSPVGLFAL